MRRKIKGFGVVKGQLVKSVGYVLTKGGKVQPRRWYLGSAVDDSAAAQAAAERIKAAWRNCDGVKEIDHGGVRVRVWAETANPLAELPKPNANATAVPSVINVGGMTVSEAAKMYLAAIEQRFNAGQVSHGFFVSTSWNLQRGLALLGHDKPLASIGATELTAAVLALAARPLTKAKPNQGKAAKPLSIKSASNYIAVLKAFLDTMGKTESAPGSEMPLWRKPLRFEDIFRDNAPKMTADEKQRLIVNGEAEADAFSVDEIRSLYSAAPDRQRLWMLLALNCGFVSMELSTLSLNQIHGLDTDAPKIKRFRGKTNIYAEWPLWSETTALLRKFLEKDNRINPNDSAVVTALRKPLIQQRNMGRRDAVRKAWVDVVSALPEARRLSFKYLRKSGARLIRHMADNIGGDAVAEMYLSHADSQHGILKAYSGRSWDKLAAALIEMRRQLFVGWKPPIRKIRMGGKRKGGYIMLTAETPIGV